jgi:capsular exopolysaccharide synthesis family protein
VNPPPGSARGEDVLRQATATHVSTLRDYLQVARRRKWIIVQAALIVPLAALAFSLHQQSQYQGSAQVLLSQQDLSSQLTGAPNYTNDPADRQAQTQASLARVPDVAQRAINTAHVQMTPTDFLGSSSVTAGTNSDILTLTVTNHNPVLAARLATAYAHAYVAYRLEQDTAPILTALTEVQAQIATLPTHGALYTSLEDKATQLRTLAALKSANASVVQQSQTAVQTAPRTKRNVILGILLGVFLGVGLAFLRDTLDTRVRSADAISEQLHLPILARLTEPDKKLRAEDRLAMISDPSGMQSEAFRVLRTNVEFASLGKEASMIMVTSATEQEGKSTTIANLAVAMARSGQHVVLIDLDLRRPYIDRFFNLEGRPGLTQVALGVAQLGEAIVRVSIGASDSVASTNGNGSGSRRLERGALDVLPSGPLPPDPGEFVGTDRLTEILEHIRAHADVVLIDAPPLLHVGDGLALSAKVDAVLVVTRMEMMRRPILAELGRLLETMPAHKLGFIVTGAEAEEGYGYGYGGYYYHRAYGPREKATARR